MGLAENAQDYVWYITPYLIITDEMNHVLSLAAKRGVDVRIITPGIPDKKIVYSLTRSYYNGLARNGVRIFEFTPGFCHAKMCISDDIVAVCGTINLDYRSLYHHFECATYMYRTACIPDIERDFQATLAKCRRVTPETIKGEKLSYKIMGQLMQFIAPLM